MSERERCVHDIDGLAGNVIAFVNQIKLICANAQSSFVIYDVSQCSAG